MKCDELSSPLTTTRHTFMYHPIRAPRTPTSPLSRRREGTARKKSPRRPRVTSGSAGVGPEADCIRSAHVRAAGGRPPAAAQDYPACPGSLRDSCLRVTAPFALAVRLSPGPGAWSRRRQCSPKLGQWAASLCSKHTGQVPCVGLRHLSTMRLTAQRSRRAGGGTRLTRAVPPTKWPARAARRTDPGTQPSTGGHSRRRPPRGPPWHVDCTARPAKGRAPWSVS